MHLTFNETIGTLLGILGWFLFLIYKTRSQEMEKDIEKLELKIKDIESKRALLITAYLDYGLHKLRLT
jgi:hypothetical protein